MSAHVNGQEIPNIVFSSTPHASLDFSATKSPVLKSPIGPMPGSPKAESSLRRSHSTHLTHSKSLPLESQSAFTLPRHIGSQLSPSPTDEKPRRRSFFNLHSNASRNASSEINPIPEHIIDVVDDLKSVKLILSSLDEDEALTIEAKDEICGTMDGCVRKLLENSMDLSDLNPHSIIKRSLTNRLNTSKHGTEDDRNVAEWIQRTYAQDYLIDEEDHDHEVQTGVSKIESHTEMSAEDEAVVEKYMHRFGHTEPARPLSFAPGTLRRESAPRVFASGSDSSEQPSTSPVARSLSVVGAVGTVQSIPGELESLREVQEDGDTFESSTTSQFTTKKGRTFPKSKPPLRRARSVVERSSSESSSVGSFKASTQVPVFGVKCDKLTSDMTKWDLDVFKLDEYSGGRPLTAIGMRICEYLGFIEEFNVSPLCLCKFYMAIEDGYFRYPAVQYHNNLHAADVLYSTFRLLQENVVKVTVSKLEMFAAIIAATCHDVHHPGNTNQFLADTNHEYAILYNDRSILENHHCAWAFTLLKKDAFNIFSGLTKDQYTAIRRMVTSMILSTDMSVHFKHLGDFRSVVDGAPEKEGSNEGFSSNKNRVIVSAVLHLADLGGSTKCWELCEKWGYRVMNEFFTQGDKEKELGLQVGPLNDRDTTFIPKSQTGFMDFVCMPLWETWDEFMGGSTIQYQNLCKNRDLWGEMVKVHEAEQQQLHKSFVLSSDDELNKSDDSDLDAIIVQRIPESRTSVASREREADQVVQPYEPQITDHTSTDAVLDVGKANMEVDPPCVKPKHASSEARTTFLLSSPGTPTPRKVNRQTYV